MALHTLDAPQPLVYAVFAVFGDGNDFGALLADAVPPQIQMDDGRVRRTVFMAEVNSTGEAATQAWPVAAEIVLLAATPHMG
ncbi:hypothetical protein H4R21_001731 [Coemansia helicoidea]|uniref:Uncharacterized protein n=1 Tax=Coemansia helicoidea TaxID=1286919 RepID=A0ACC1LBE6_9FUNG|nr:hypothetical protein H4R21_001731 [Coemansia helicoidea]